MPPRIKLSPNKQPFCLSLGARGEMAAWNYLRKKGYQILDKNYRAPIGEIDAVCKKDGRIIFVEIKTRSGNRFGVPEEAVHRIKQKKLILLAEWYLKDKKCGDVPVAFAVVSILMDPAGSTPQIRLIENAFGVE
jgi:putative endonuclease